MFLKRVAFLQVSLLGKGSGEAPVNLLLSRDQVTKVDGTWHIGTQLETYTIWILGRDLCSVYKLYIFICVIFRHYESECLVPACIPPTTCFSFGGKHFSLSNAAVNVVQGVLNCYTSCVVCLWRDAENVKCPCLRHAPGLRGVRKAKL